MKPLQSNVTLGKARSTILHLLLARPSSVPFTLANISTFMSSASGLDKSLMIIQYPAKIAVALLVALAAKLAKENHRKGLSAGGILLGREALRSRAALYAVRLKALSSSIGDARTMMRLLGKSGHSLLDNSPHPSFDRHHSRPRLDPIAPLIGIKLRSYISSHQYPPNCLPHPLLSAREPLIPFVQGRLPPLSGPGTQLEHMELPVLGGVRRVRRLEASQAEEADADQGKGNQVADAG